MRWIRQDRLFVVLEFPSDGKPFSHHYTSFGTLMEIGGADIEMCSAIKAVLWAPEKMVRKGLFGGETV